MIDQDVIEETNGFTMPSSPADRQKIKDQIYEMSGALQFIDDKRAYMKDVAEALQEEFEIPKKITMKMARTVHKNNYRDVEAEADQFTTMFETLFKGGELPVDDSDDDSDED